MDTTLLLPGVFALVSVVSIVLAVINWAQVGTAVSRVGRLETEIEKKAHEFDVLRKERASSPAPSASRVTPAPMNLDESTMRREAFESSGSAMRDDDIEIVRNVRPGYEVPKSDPDSYQTPDMTTPSAFEENEDHSRPAIEVALYSSRAGGADLQELYRVLSTTLPSTPEPRVVIDLAGIDALHPQQIDYLARVCRSIAAQNGTVTLARSAPRLRAQLGGDATLAPFLDR